MVLSEVAEMLCQRAEKYNDSLRQLKQLEKDGTVFVIRPEKPIEIKRIENNPVKTRKIFEEGVNAAKQNLPRLKQWVNAGSENTMPQKKA